MIPRSRKIRRVKCKQDTRGTSDQCICVTKRDRPLPSVFLHVFVLKKRKRALILEETAPRTKKDNRGKGEHRIEGWTDLEITGRELGGTRRSENMSARDGEMERGGETR